MRSRTYTDGVAALMTHLSRRPAPRSSVYSYESPGETQPTCLPGRHEDYRGRIDPIAETEKTGPVRLRRLSHRLPGPAAGA
jgi:hypothetical protein